MSAKPIPQPLLDRFESEWRQVREATAKRGSRK